MRRQRREVQQTRKTKGAKGFHSSYSSFLCTAKTTPLPKPSPAERPSSLLLAYHAYINHSDPKNSQESRWRTDLQLTDHPNVLVRLGDYASIKRLEQNQTFRDPTPCNIQWGITYSSLIRPFLSSWRRATLPALLLAPSLRPS